jgi:lipoate-protein ligase A
MGSAQRRRLDRVLMHGSLIVGRSPAAPEVLGLLDLLPSMPERRLLEDALVTAVEHALHLRFDPNDLPQEVQERAAELAKNKYRTAEWNDRIPGSKAR